MAGAGSPGHALLPLLLLAGCITEPDLKVRRDVRPEDTGDGWTVSSPSAERFDQVQLDLAVDLFYSGDRYHNAISLLVVRHGRLVLEAFARDPREREIKRNTQSLTKSVTSLVFGIARDRGYFPDLDATLFSILPEKFDDDPAKRRITLRHLLAMRSGLGFDNDRFSREILMDPPRDIVRHILGKPLYAEPGDSFYYRDADPHLLSAALQRVTGMTLEAFARETLFGPLGINDYYWEPDAEGTSLGPVALFLRGRDMARIGEMVLRRGAFGRCGQDRCRIVSAEWIDESTSPHSASWDPAYPYGYYWWVVPELGGFTAVGHGGQFIMVVPHRELVIVLTSLPSTDDDVVGTTLERFMPMARLIVAAAVPDEPG